jgi:hypothetical protein
MKKKTPFWETKNPKKTVKEPLTPAQIRQQPKARAKAAWTTLSKLW